MDAYVPASRLIPSLPTTTHEELHRPQTSRSLPSFVHPHLEAATALIDSGLLAYVASLKVSRRERNDWREEGRYSADAGRRDGDSELNLKVNALLAFEATRLSIAVRCGVFAPSSGAVLLRRNGGVDL